MNRLAHLEDSLRERAAGYCEACGLPLTGDEQRHHRQARGMGGDRREPNDTLDTVILVHARCHSRIHAHPERARELGLIVAQGTDPATVPVCLSVGLRGLR